MMKKCCYCHKDLVLNTGIVCEKCKSNEAKYGKPGVCKYCQLPAAFLDEKCVHCSYSERKHGSPVVCSRCQLKCAFPKSPSLKNKPILCRLCMLAHGPSQQASAGTSATKPSKRRSSRHHHHSADVKSHHHHHHHDGSQKKDDTVQNGHPQLPTTNTNSGLSTPSKRPRDAVIDHDMVTIDEHIRIIQPLKDKILELTITVQGKDKLIQEKDMKIGELNAEILRKDKEHRTKLQELQKRNIDMVTPLQEQIRNLTKQVSHLQKAQQKF